MWVTPRQARLVTGLERYQLDWLRKTNKISAKKWGRMWIYDAGDLYRISEQAREVLSELTRFSERTESGRHFTEAFRHWRVLEECGWIRVERPAHQATGISYDQSYWRAELTEEGMQVAEFAETLLEEPVG